MFTRPEYGEGSGHHRLEVLAHRLFRESDRACQLGAPVVRVRPWGRILAHDALHKAVFERGTDVHEPAATGSTVRLSAGTQRRDFGYVEDVAEGLLRLGLSSGAPGQVVNLATGRLSSVREFAETAAHVLGLSPDRLEFGTEPVRADEMQISGVEVARLRDLTGFSLPSDLDALLRRATSFETRLARISR